MAQTQTHLGLVGPSWGLKPLEEGLENLGSGTSWGPESLEEGLQNLGLRPSWGPESREGAHQDQGEEEDNQVCVFPVVGRLDPRSQWVPLHYLRGLLSLVGGRMFQYLGVDGVEVWLLRAVARTFRRGKHSGPHMAT